MRTLKSLNPKITVYVLGMLSLALFPLCGLLFFSLAVVDFNFVSPRLLSPVYVTYFASTVLWLHCLAFYLHLDAKISRGRGLSKQVPKYLDYAVTAILAIGIMQISFADEWAAKYIDEYAGSKIELIDKIRARAQKDIKYNCGKDVYYTKEYCDRLQEISSEPNLAEFIQAKLFGDSKFLNHSTYQVSVFSGAVPGMTQMRGYIYQYRAILDYESTNDGTNARSAWSWLTLLLLPFVIALRALKTSLELFAELS
jgi:hypothetical protein